MSFAAFVRAERRALVGLAGSLTGDPVEAEDVVADVLGRVWERWDQVQAADRPGAYAHRMVVNEFLSRKRRQRRVLLTPTLAEDYALISDHAASHAERDELRTRLNALPVRQRAAIALRYYADLPDEQIAEMLGCTTGTVRSLISRALTTLRVSHDPPEPNSAISERTSSASSPPNMTSSSASVAPTHQETV